jgi:AAA+ superfamily predicted ATPase
MTESPPGSHPGVGAPWLDLADVLLQRAALARRVSRDVAPDPLAGLRIGDDELDRLLTELPGLDDGARDRIDDALGDRVAEAYRDFVGAATDESLFARVVANCGLSLAESLVLALLVAVELDPRRQRLVGYLNDDVAQRRLTAVSLRLVTAGLAEPLDVLGAVGPSGGLRRACLVQVDADAPWASAPLRVHADVVWWALGETTPAGGLPDGVRVIDQPGRGAADVVVVSGQDRIRRTQAVVAAVEAHGFLLTPVPSAPSGWDAVVRFASLAGLCVVLETDDDLPAAATDRVDRTPQLAWAVSSPSPLALASLPRRRWTHLDTFPANASADEIAAVLGPAVGVVTQLTTDQLDAVAGAAQAMNGDVRAAVRRLAAGASKQFTERIVPARGWDDLVLNERDSTRLREVAIRARHARQVFGEWGFDANSSGVLALFAGPSGTGKTLAAEVVANELGLDLFRVDLSQVVDKYIGETEKRFGQLFDVAEASPMVLFLDEADALLAKRTDVSDAHDRYANLEVAYLLQRLERHNGVAIFASNLATNIDAAFTRRIHVSISFQMPGPAERRRIWERCVPAAVRSAEIDWDLLAEVLELSGGQIRNIAVRAAFLAAELGTTLTMELLVEAAEREMSKSGRIFPTDRLLRARTAQRS